MSSPGWATVGITASGDSFFTFSMSVYCARIHLSVFGYPSQCHQGENCQHLSFVDLPMPRRSSGRKTFARFYAWKISYPQWKELSPIFPPDMSYNRFVESFPFHNTTGAWAPCPRSMVTCWEQSGSMYFPTTVPAACQLT